MNFITALKYLKFKHLKEPNNLPQEMFRLEWIDNEHEVLSLRISEDQVISTCINGEISPDHSGLYMNDVLADDWEIRTALIFE